MSASSARVVSQRHTTALKSVERLQPDLALKHASAQEIPFVVQIARARECQSFGMAMVANATAAGLDYDKQVSGSLGLDKAQLSRWQSNVEGIKEGRFFQHQHLCGNWIPLLYLVDRAGFDPASLRLRETELERENRELREQLAAARRLLIGGAR